MRVKQRKSEQKFSCMEHIMIYVQTWICICYIYYVWFFFFRLLHHWCHGNFNAQSNNANKKWDHCMKKLPSQLEHDCGIAKMNLKHFTLKTQSLCKLSTERFRKRNQILWRICQNNDDETIAKIPSTTTTNIVSNSFCLICLFSSNGIENPSN